MNDLVKALEANRGQIETWFEHLHRNPELSMREEQTAQYSAGLLREWSYDVTTGVGKHGIVASLTAGSGTKAIGLRADFDALPIQEDNDLPYKSTVSGIGHLCGHDGHAVGGR